MTDIPGSKSNPLSEEQFADQLDEMCDRFEADPTAAPVYLESAGGRLVVAVPAAAYGEWATMLDSLSALEAASVTPDPYRDEYRRVWRPSR
jgi:hypothetical protein